jgi:hypothetical protein
MISCKLRKDIIYTHTHTKRGREKRAALKAEANAACH